MKKNKPKKIDKWKGRCHACGEKKTPEQLTVNNGSVCQQCHDRILAKYQKDKKEGRVNDVVIFCQECQSQFRPKREDGKVGVNPHKLTNQHDRALELHDGIPFKISALILTEWECKCKNKKPIITTGIDYSNWAEGFIDEINQNEWMCCPPDKR